MTGDDLEETPFSVGRFKIPLFCLLAAPIWAAATIRAFSDTAFFADPSEKLAATLLLTYLFLPSRCAV